MTNRIDPFDELAAMFLTAPQPTAPTGESRASAKPMTPADGNMHTVMTELLLVGHLPVRAGLWLVPYADLLARQVGAVGLIRLDAAEPTLQLLRAPEHYATASLGMGLQHTIMDLASCVDAWILRAGERVSPDEALDCRPDRITILSSADEAAVVAAYQTIKELVQAAEHPHRTLPAICMAMVGCDNASAEAAIDRLNRTTISFLGVEVRLAALLPRMDAGIKCTRYVTFGDERSPGVLDVRRWIEQAKHQPRAATSTPQTTPPPAATPPHAPHADLPVMPPHTTTPPTQQPQQYQHESPVIGRIAPPPETFVHDARRILREPTREFTNVPPPPYQPPSMPPTAPAHHPPAPAATSPPISPTRQTPASVTPAERDDLLGVLSGTTHGPAKLPPKVVIEFENKPAPSQRAIIEPDERGSPIPLARFVAGLTALPIRPPGHERIELAVDSAGCIHLLSRETELRELPVVERWAHAHRELLAMACPNLRFDPAGTTMCHVFTAEPALLADLHGSRLHLHVLAPVAVGQTTAWYSAPLNIVR